ncbi:MAG: phospho-sugar mutase, partial [Leifsonia sp.]
MSEEQTDDLIERAQAWVAQDPDQETRDELNDLIVAAQSGSAEAVADLHSRFDARLAFGTAGLRGEIAAGPNRMNRVLVAQAAAGFARYLLDHANGTTPSVVIGYDGRKNSDVFARDTAELMAGAGVRAVLLPRLLPTPVLAFAVRHLDVSAGVMVTASHNPPNDNGYKVYLGGENHGSQIVSPVDAEIESRILEVAAGSILDLPRAETYEVGAEDIERAYIAATAAVASTTAARDAVSYVYTAMHGVGWRTARDVFAAAGFAEPTVVAAQIDPD